jgi:DNA-directed RNA polymerase subunit M/transcription elongation factor TFIIS
MDIRFSCPACGHHMVIDAAGAGMIVECPACGKDAPVPKSIEKVLSSKPTPPPIPATEKDRTVALKWTPPSSEGPKH